MPRQQGTHLTELEKVVAQDAFLTHYANTANFRYSCEAAGVTKSTVYRWCEHDNEFALRKNQADADAADFLQHEAWVRATAGYLKPVISQGHIVYDRDGEMLMERVVSDALLIRLMAWRIKGFSEKQQVESTIEVLGAKDSLLAKLDAVREVAE